MFFGLDRPGRSLHACRSLMTRKVTLSTNDPGNRCGTVSHCNAAGMLMCCCGGCLCGYKAQRCRSVIPRARHRRVADPLRGEPPPHAPQSRHEPGSGRLCVRDAPHGAFSLGVPRASAGVPNPATARACSRRDAGKPAPRCPLSSGSLFSGASDPSARSPSPAQDPAPGRRAAQARAPAGLRESAAELLAARSRACVHARVPGSGP